MVTALANGIYLDGGNNYSVAKNKQAIKIMSLSLKNNFQALKKRGVPITPAKLNLFRICPNWIMNIALRCVYNTKFAEIFISNHAQNAKKEMELLDMEFKQFLST